MTRPILIADDEPNIRDVVRFALKKAGFETLEAKNGREALTLAQSAQPCLVVLDILMPELDGLEVCKRLRTFSQVPIVFLSSRDEELDRILGLELGGDDYLTKPFSPRELVARVKAVLRRFEPVPAALTSASHGPAASPASLGTASHASGRLLTHSALSLDLDRCQLAWKGKDVSLTATELGLLRTLMSFPGKVFTRDELITRAYDGEVAVSDRTIDSHIRRVRRKLELLGLDPIETHHGLGYRLKEHLGESS